MLKRTLPHSLKLMLLGLFTLMALCMGFSAYALAVITLPEVLVAIHLPNVFVPLFAGMVAVSLTMLVYKCTVSTYLIQDFRFLDAIAHASRQFRQINWTHELCHQRTLLALLGAGVLGLALPWLGGGLLPWHMVLITAAAFICFRLGRRAIYGGFAVIALLVGQSMISEWFDAIKQVTALYHLSLPPELLLCVAVLAGCGFTLMILDRGTQPIRQTLRALDAYLARHHMPALFWQAMLIVAAVAMLTLLVAVFSPIPFVLPGYMNLALAAFVVLTVCVFAAPKAQELLGKVKADLKQPSDRHAFEKVVYAIASIVDFFITCAALAVHTTGEGAIAGHGAYVELHSPMAAMGITVSDAATDALADASTLDMGIDEIRERHPDPQGVIDRTQPELVQVRHDHEDHHEHGMRFVKTLFQFFFYVTDRDIQNRELVYRQPKKTDEARDFYTPEAFVHGRSDYPIWVRMSLKVRPELLFGGSKKPQGEEVRQGAAAGRDDQYVYLPHAKYMRIRRWVLLKYITLSLMFSVVVVNALWLTTSWSPWLIALVGVASLFGARGYFYTVQRIDEERGDESFFAHLFDWTRAILQHPPGPLKRAPLYLLAALAGFATGANGGVRLIDIMHISLPVAVMIALSGVIIEGIFYATLTEEFFDPIVPSSSMAQEGPQQSPAAYYHLWLPWKASRALKEASHQACRKADAQAHHPSPAVAAPGA